MGNTRSGHDLVLREMPHKVRDLHYAVMSNDRDTVCSLVQQGVNVNFPWFNPSNPSIKDGSTPLICAVSLNHTDIIQLLLHAGAYINKCDRNGCTPIYKAAFHGRPTLIELLAKAGADVNLADYMGKTPLYICVNNAIVHTGSCKLAVQKLIKGGAIVDKSDKNGQAPLHIASHWKLREVMQMLINVKANVNIADRKGRTPLWVCVSSLSTKLYAEDLRHQFPCILTLFRNGADMLNLTEWILFKGPGIPEDLLKSAPDFEAWYFLQVTQPMTLKNICRKVIQKCVSSKGDMVDICIKLPLPHSVQKVLFRRMFYREQRPP